MPQKLIRLTSNSGDGVFNGVFNEEILVKENSEIALQSISVERESQQIIITGANGDVSFSSVESAGDSTFEEVFALMIASLPCPKNRNCGG